MPAPFDLLDPLIRGAVVTLGLTIAGGCLMVVVAFLAGLARLSPFWVLRLPASIFVELFRGSAFIVQLFLIFYFLPGVGIRVGPIETAILALGLNHGAYGSEIVRGAVLAVDQGQRDAATALNMSRALAMRRIILPQAAVIMLPPLGNILIQLLKGSSLVSLITVTELALAGRLLVQNTGRTSEVYVLVLGLYFVMAYALSLIIRETERRASKGLKLGRAVQ